MSEPGRISLGARLALALIATLFCMAPVPGDIGGCGQAAQDLDPGVFFATKKRIDCDRCGECGLGGGACELACDESSRPPRAFPERCYPLVHDGEVCLRALRRASCDDFATYVDEVAPRTPTECDFCPVEGTP
ncbi:MAG: hypothetical protein OZ921_02645 [Sorangiineae bacterium]|nr:hypothetical protein [Polyangiaceae bacterium]MEB2321385.1 hypothetical protein [Sorangiineae bacterium]